jgi:hypothetical protein
MRRALERPRAANDGEVRLGSPFLTVVFSQPPAVTENEIPARLLRA